MSCCHNSIPEFEGSSNKLAVAVGYTSRTQLHAGILYKYKESIKCVHLAFHYYFENQELDKAKFAQNWVEPNIPVLRQEAMADMLYIIGKRNAERGIPYGLMYKDTTFAGDGKLLLGDDEIGLTCATFVLAVFKSLGITLVQVGDWVSRTGDEVWQKSVIETLVDYMNKRGWSDADIEVYTKKIEAEVGCARFRPEEVAVSTMFSHHPGTQEVIVEAAKCMLGKL